MLMDQFRTVEDTPLRVIVKVCVLHLYIDFTSEFLCRADRFSLYRNVEAVRYSRYGHHQNPRRYNKTQEKWVMGNYTL